MDPESSRLVYPFLVSLLTIRHTTEPGSQPRKVTSHSLGASALSPAELGSRSDLHVDNFSF